MLPVKKFELQLYKSMYNLEYSEKIKILTLEDLNKYTKDEKNLFYVACTRTQHQLIIYNQ